MKATHYIPILILISYSLINFELLSTTGSIQIGGAINYGETVTGEVSSADGDEWTFTGSVDDFISIEMNGISLGDTFLVLLDPAGVQLVSDDDSGPGLDSWIRSYSLPTTGQYTIIARGYSGELGTYTLILERIEYGAGEDVSVSLRFGEQVEGRITTQAGDRWTFAGQAGDLVTIEMNGVTLGDSYLELLGTDGSELVSDDDSGQERDALISEYLLPGSGTYTVIARGYGGETGSYTLSLDREESGDVGGFEGSLSYGETVEDQVTTLSGDQWTFQAESGDIISIELNGGTLEDSYLELFGPDGDLLTHDDDSGPDLDSLISGFVLPETGEYTIVARGFGEETGAYALSLESGVQDIESEGFLSYGDQIENVVSNSIGDEWYFTGDADDIVSVELTGSTLDDTYLELYGPDGRRLAYDDDGGPDLNSLINGFTLPESGTYTVVARGYGGNTGTYTLHLREGFGQVIEGFEGPLSYGIVVSGRASDEDGEEWTFNGQAGDSVTIAMNGITLGDPYLLLFGPDGAVEASDDDSGPGLNSIISDFTLPSSGRYTIVARGFGARTGTYNLALAGEPGGSANMPGVPQIASIEYPACGSGATYFVLSLDGADEPNHHFYKVTIEALDDEAVIQHIYPAMGTELDGQISETTSLDIAGEVINLTGMGTINEIQEAINQYFNRQDRPDIREFSITWYETGNQPSLEFVVLVTHSGDVGVDGLIEWQQDLDGTVSEHRFFIDCG